MEDDNIIVLLDEDDNEVEFEYLDTIEYLEKEYVVLAPLDVEDEDELNVVIFEIEHLEDEDSFVIVEDQEILETVFEIFKERYDVAIDNAMLEENEDL